MSAQPQFAEPLFQEQPGLVAQGRVAALGFIGIGAKEDLPTRIKPAEPGELVFGQRQFGRIWCLGQGSALLADDPGDLRRNHALHQGRQVLVEPLGQRRPQQFPRQTFERGFARADDLRWHSRLSQHGERRQ